MHSYFPDITNKSETFHTPYQQYADREGQNFTIIGEMTDEECLDDGYDIPYEYGAPKWKIRFEDGYETYAWAEEIFEDLPESQRAAEIERIELVEKMNEG